MKSTDKEFQDAVSQEIPLVFNDIINFKKLYERGELSTQEVIRLWGIVQRTQVNNPLFYENVEDINNAVNKLSLDDIDDVLYMFDVDKWINTMKYIQEHNDELKYMKSLLYSIDILLTALSIRDNLIRNKLKNGEEIGDIPEWLTERIVQSAYCFSQIILNAKLLEPIRPHIHLMTYLGDVNSDDLNENGFVYSALNEVFEQEELLEKFSKTNLNDIASFFINSNKTKEVEKNPLEEEK